MAKYSPQRFCSQSPTPSTISMIAYAASPTAR